MLTSLAAIMGGLKAPDQGESRCLIGHCIADLLHTFAHFRHHPGDDLLQAASAALLNGLQDLEQQVRCRLCADVVFADPG